MRILILLLISIFSFNINSQPIVEELNKKEARNEVKRLYSVIDSLNKVDLQLKLDNNSLENKLKNIENELRENNNNFDKFKLKLLSENQNLKRKIDSLTDNSKNFTKLLKSIFLNSDLYKIDTMYKVLIGTRLCKFIFVRENYNKEGDKIDSNLDSIELYDESIKQLLILDFKTDNLLFIKRFEFDVAINSFFRIHKLNSSLLETGKVFIDWIVSGGGSGYASKTYTIDFNGDNKIELELLFDSGELSNICFLNNQFIVINGIWNFDEKETHFSEHRCEIKFINFNNQQEDLITIKKYETSERSYIELLREIFKNEATLKNSILKYSDIEKYSEYNLDNIFNNQYSY